MGGTRHNPVTRRVLAPAIGTGTDTGATTEDFNSGKAAIGAGPFRLVANRPGDRMELERFDQYWGRKPDWQHVTYRVITNGVRALSRG